MVYGVGWIIGLMGGEYKAECGTLWSSANMSSRDDSVIAPVLPAPVPRRGRMPLFQFFRTLRDNMIATYGEEAYARDIIERKMFGRSRFLVSAPPAITHVLLDNAANYR